MQCLLVGIEIIQANPGSPTHSAGREVFNASVGRDRMMTHCSCLHLESKKNTREKFPKQQNKSRKKEEQRQGGIRFCSCGCQALWNKKKIKKCDKVVLWSCRNIRFVADSPCMGRGRHKRVKPMTIFKIPFFGVIWAILGVFLETGEGHSWGIWKTQIPST